MSCVGQVAAGPRLSRGELGSAAKRKIRTSVKDERPPHNLIEIIRAVGKGTQLDARLHPALPRGGSMCQSAKRGGRTLCKGEQRAACTDHAPHVWKELNVLADVQLLRL